MDRKIVLECGHMTFSYSQERTVFEDVTLKVKAGAFIHLQGPSGSGKSTFLRLLNRLEEPDSGDILFHDVPLASYPPSELRRSIAYIQQTPTLIDDTVRNNLALPFGFKVNRHLPFPDDGPLMDLFEEFLLTGVKLTDVGVNLSGGQRQRLCLLRSMLLSPEIMLLDEPTSALDPESRQAVENIILKLNRDRGITIILASHQGFCAEEAPLTLLRVADRRIEEVAPIQQIACVEEE